MYSRWLLLISVVILLSTICDGVVHYRVLNQLINGKLVPPKLNVSIDGVQLNTRPITVKHAIDISITQVEPCVYYTIGAGVHQLKVVDAENGTTYWDTSLPTFVDGAYYSTMISNTSPWTLEDDSGTSVPFGYAKVRFVNSWTNTAGSYFNLTIDGLDDASFASGQVANGDYYMLPNAATYNFTIYNQAATWMSAYNQSFGNGASTFWLILDYAYGGYYNGTGFSNTFNKRLIDGAAAPQALSLSTTPAPDVTQTVPTSTKPSTAPPPASSTSSLLTAAVIVPVLIAIVIFTSQSL